MRVLVVVAGMTLGLSGCIGGGIVYRGPAGNETAGAEDGVDIEQAPWQLNGTVGPRDGTEGAKKGAGGVGDDGKTAGKNPGDTQDPGDGPDPPDEPGENGTGPGEDPDMVENVTDQTPTTGAAADDVVGGVDDPTTTEVPTPKGPLEAADGVDPGDVDAESVPTSTSVPVSGASGTPKAGAIPTTDTSLA